MASVQWQVKLQEAYFAGDRYAHIFNVPGEKDVFIKEPTVMAYDEGGAEYMGHTHCVYKWYKKYNTMINKTKSIRAELLKVADDKDIDHLVSLEPVFVPFFNETFLFIWFREDQKKNHFVEPTTTLRHGRGGGVTGRRKRKNTELTAEEDNEEEII